MELQRVLLITADQWRGDSLGCAGHEVVKTPHADALARDGMLFSRHYCCAVPCGPSRATLLTGLYPTNHRMITNGTPLNGSLTNLALELRKGGYDPVLFGYTDITPDPRYHSPADPALRSYEGILPGFTVGELLTEDGKPWLASLRRLGYEVPGPGLAIYRPQEACEDRRLSSQPAVYKAEHSESAWLTDRIIDHIDFLEGESFFIHASYLRPHPPFIAPEPYNDLYRDVDIPAPIRAITPADEFSQHPAVPFFHDSKCLNDFVLGVDDRKLTELSDEDICNLRATYYGLISEVDSQIGRLIEHLKQCGLYEKTLIVLTSDHGEQLGDHYLFGKQCHFEESYHIPLIIKGAGDEFRRGETLARFTESVDIMPTVLESCGLPVPHQCDGRSLLPFLRGETLDDWRNEVCGLYDFRNVRGKNAEKRFGLRSDQCALMFIRDEKYKYVHYTALAPALYELEQDPGELNNLASDPAFRQVMLEYAQRLLSWRMRNEYGALDLMVAAEGGIHVGEG